MGNFDNLESFMALIDQVYDEICIWDSEHRVVYINEACCRHYGLRPKEFIGKKLSDLCMQDKLWFPTVVMDTMEMKKPVIQRQRTILGQDITTISVPVFDSADNVKYRVTHGMCIGTREDGKGDLNIPFVFEHQYILK